MDAAVRHLKDGRNSKERAPMSLIIQQPDSVGGAAMLSQMMASILAAQRVDHCGAVAIPFVESDVTTRKALPTSHQNLLTVVPYKSDLAHSFLSFIQQAIETHVQRCKPGQSIKETPHSLYIVIDSLSTCFLYHTPHQVLTCLRELQRSPQVAGILTMLDTQLQTQQQLDMVRTLATCETLLRPVNHSQAEVMLVTTKRHVHIEAITSTLRHSGRIKIDSALYEMLTSGRLRQHRAPADTAITAQQLAASEIAELSKSTATKEVPDQDNLQSKYEKDMSGFMKLSLSRKEKEDRDKVVLPYVHRGENETYSADKFSTYLPPSAGGHGKGSGNDGQGHILYVRDSDNDCDSDEDPDDDLDI